MAHGLTRRAVKREFESTTPPKEGGPFSSSSRFFSFATLSLIPATIVPSPLPMTQQRRKPAPAPNVLFHDSSRDGPRFDRPRESNSAEEKAAKLRREKAGHSKLLLFFLLWKKQQDELWKTQHFSHSSHNRAHLRTVIPESNINDWAW
jgi:hypothetical protein